MSDLYWLTDERMARLKPLRACPLGRSVVEFRFLHRLRCPQSVPGFEMEVGPGQPPGSDRSLSSRICPRIINVDAI